MSRMVGTLTFEHSVASWTVEGRRYETTLQVWPRGDIHCYCPCQSFRDWCKHLAAVWLEEVAPTLRRVGRPQSMPPWLNRPEWLTDEVLAEHRNADEIREGHHEPLAEYEGDPFDGLAPMTSEDLIDSYRGRA